jgi:hypothetical protein
LENWEPSQHSLVNTGKPRETCAEVERGYFILHTYFQNESWRRYFLMVNSPYKEERMNSNQWLKLYIDDTEPMSGAG